MKFLVVLSGLLAVTWANYCYNDVVSSCSEGVSSVDLVNCNAKYGAFHTVMSNLQSYANDHISHSFDYLLMATHFGNYEMNREGFEKLFRKLSDSTWNDAIGLIKYITKRGGTMNFSERKAERDKNKTIEAPGLDTHKSFAEGVQPNDPEVKDLELYELNALARGLDIQKRLAKEAHNIHSLVTRRDSENHDPEVSSYLEEHFLHDQASEVRKLAGYISDLKRLLSETESIEKNPKKKNIQRNPVNKQASLAVFLFDEYLQKAV